MKLVLEILKDHPDNQEDMARCSGFQVISFLLRRISPRHMTPQTVQLIPNLLHVVRNNETLYADVVKFLLFDFKLWILTDVEVQKKFVGQLIMEIERIRQGDIVDQTIDVNKSYRSRFRALIGLQRILDLLRIFYWCDGSETDIILGTEKICNPSTNEVLGERPGSEDTMNIRTSLLKLAKIVVNADIPTNVDIMVLEEVQALIYFLADCRDIAQLLDICRFVIELLLYGSVEQMSTVADFMFQVDAYEVFVNLLYVTPSIPVRLLALKCIGRLLMLSKQARQKYGADGPVGFSYITNILKQYTFTEETYSTLRDIFLGQISLTEQKSPMRDFDELDISQSNSMGPVMQNDSSLYQFEVQAVLDCIFKLLLTASVDVKLSVLSDWKLQLKSFHVQDVFLKQPGWQTWLFSLMANQRYSFTDFEDEEILQDPVQNESMEVVREIILDIITILLYHALVHSKQGWRIVEETIAHLYTFEESDLLFDAQTIIGKVWLRLLDSYIAAAQRKLITISFTDKNTPVLDNFLHLMTYIEEYMFYSQITNEQLYNKWLKKAVPLLAMMSPTAQTPLGTATQYDSNNDLSSLITRTQSYDSTVSDNLGTPRKGDVSGNSPPLTPLSTGPLIRRGTAMMSASFTSPTTTTPSRTKPYDAEIEIKARKDEEQHWVDLPIAQKLISLLHMWNLSSVANFTALSNITQQGSKRLRTGGSLRVCLRLIRYCLRESYTRNSLYNIFNISS
jgi:hypothetical protein